MHTVKKLFYKLYVYMEYNLRYGRIEDMTVSEAKKLLNNFYPQKPPKFQQQVNYNPEYDLMIVVPVYNTEDYLDECIQSLIRQNTKYSYKIVFVDDGSTDCSGGILDSYNENEKVKIIHQKNRGIAGARNRALKNICGRYILFVDSDDVLAENAIELLMDAALAQNADITEGTHIEFTNSRLLETEGEIDKLSGYPWGKVIAAEKLIDLCFPEGYQYEDTIISTLLIPSCNNIYTIPKITYYYRRNENSITVMLDKKRESIDTLYMTYYCFYEAFKRGYKIRLEDFLHQVRLNWLRTQNLPEEVRKAIFISEIDIYSQLFAGKVKCNEKRVRNLESVLRKQSFAGYEWLMNNWQIFNCKKRNLS